MIDGDNKFDASQVQELIESWGGLAAFARSRHLDVLASNALARSLSPAYVPGANLARYTFLHSTVDPDSEVWTNVASDVVALLRDSLEQHEEDATFLALVGELATQSHLFATLWAEPGRPVRRSATIIIRHDQLGMIALVYQELHISDDFDTVLVVLYPHADDESRARFHRLRDSLITPAS